MTQKTRTTVGIYDPAVRAHIKGKHKGMKQPAGLRAYWAARKGKSKGTHLSVMGHKIFDPAVSMGSRKHTYTGMKGGKYFTGSLGTKMKKRYDPAPTKKSISRKAHSVGAGIERVVGSNWGYGIGAALAALIGVIIGYQAEAGFFKANGYSASKPDPTGAKTPWQRWLNLLVGTKENEAEIEYLWKSTSGGWTPSTYLQYKFLGKEPTGGKYKLSAWMIPFWGGIAAAVAGLFLKGKYRRIGRPLTKIGVGMVAMGAVGALAIPGCRAAQTTTKGVDASKDSGLARALAQFPNSCV